MIFLTTFSVVVHLLHGSKIYCMLMIPCQMVLYPTYFLLLLPISLLSEVCCRNIKMCFLQHYLVMCHQTEIQVMNIVFLWCQMLNLCTKVCTAIALRNNCLLNSRQLNCWRVGPSGIHLLLGERQYCLSKNLMGHLGFVWIIVLLIS